MTMNHYVGYADIVVADIDRDRGSLAAPPTGSTPGAPQAAREDAVFDSAFPFERQGRLLRSRSISGLFSRSLHSGLQPPCLRFATAVTGRHARLGSWLLARLCHGRHRRRQTSTRLQGATLIEPDWRVWRIRLSGKRAHGRLRVNPGNRTSLRVS